jgi:hypothetical protein
MEAAPLSDPLAAPFSDAAPVVKPLSWTAVLPVTLATVEPVDWVVSAPKKSLVVDLSVDMSVLLTVPVVAVVTVPRPLDELLSEPDDAPVPPELALSVTFCAWAAMGSASSATTAAAMSLSMLVTSPCYAATDVAADNA